MSGQKSEQTVTLWSMAEKNDLQQRELRTQYDVFLTFNSGNTAFPAKLNVMQVSENIKMSMIKTYRLKPIFSTFVKIKELN